MDCSKLDRLDFFAIEPLWLQAVRLLQPVLKFWSVIITKWVVVCTDKKTKMCGFKESGQLASLKGGLSRGARVTQRSSAHVGVPQFVTTGKVSDEVQETENPETFPIQSDTIVESSSVGDEHDQQVVQSSAANFDSPQIAEAMTMRELVDSLMDEQRVLEQVIDSDKEFSSKLGSDILETCPQCNKEDDGSEVELLQHHQHSGFQEHRYCTALPLVLLHFFPQF